MKISNEILNILDQCKIDENVVFLPQIQLDRKTYLEVNKCLESIGGKWNRKEKGHLFEENPNDLLENLMISGEVIDVKKEFQFFETPKEMAELMIEMAELKDSDVILEPSAGQGAIANLIPNNERVHIIELNPKNYEKLQYNHSVLGDFLEVETKELYDKVIMNPPFSKQQDVDHILHAFDCLKPGGILVSVVSESPFFRENKKSTEFRNWLEEHNAEVIKNDDGAFKSSGTMVNTRIIKVVK